MTPEVKKWYLQAYLIQYINKTFNRLQHIVDEICTITTNESLSDRWHLKLKYFRKSIEVFS